MATDQSSLVKINVELSGARPIMFDRYAGDNQTQLPTEEKMYLGKDRQLIIPSINLFGLLCSEHSGKCASRFVGKGYKAVAQAVAANVGIDPLEITILDAENNPVIFKGFNEQIRVMQHVARVKGGIPNPKIRPVLELPWKIRFTVSYEPNSECSIETLRTLFMKGGSLGLGTFRPFYGLYNLTQWEIAA